MEIEYSEDDQDKTVDDQGKTVDVQARLEYARAAVAVPRALRIIKGTMRYGEFAVAIGLISEGDKWRSWHRNQLPQNSRSCCRNRKASRDKRWNFASRVFSSRE